MVLPIFRKREWLEPPLEDWRVVGFGSTKGGAGRTTMTIETASLTAFIKGARVAVIDWDVVNPRLTQRLFKSLPMRGQTLVRIITAKDFKKALRNVSLHSVAISQTAKIDVMPALSYEDIDQGVVDEYFALMYEKPEEYVKRSRELILTLKKEYEWIMNDYPAITWVALGHLSLSINHVRATAGNLVIVVDPSPWSAELLNSKLILPKLEGMYIGALVVNMVRPAPEAYKWARSVFEPICHKIRAANLAVIPFDVPLYEAGIGEIKNLLSVSVSPLKHKSRSARFLYSLVSRFTSNEREPRCFYIGP